MNINDKPKVGDRVVHGTFGPGLVTGVKSETLNDGAVKDTWDVLRVHFDYHGIRELVWTFAYSKIEREIPNESH